MGDLNLRDSKIYVANVGPPGADRAQMGPMLAPWTLLSGLVITVSAGGLEPNGAKPSAGIVLTKRYIRLLPCFSAISDMQGKWFDITN